MVIPFVQVTTARKRSPILNEASGNVHSTWSRAAQVSKHLFEEVRQTPEVIGLLDTLVTDHFQGEVEFYDTQGKPLGPTQLKKAKQFWQMHNMNRIFYGMGIDYFVDGSAFGWKGQLKNSPAFKEMKSEVLSSLSRTKALGLYPSAGSAADAQIDEEGNKIRAFDYVAASTMHIIHDEHDVIRYIQEAAGKKRTYTREEIVHLKLMEWNGEVRSHSPLKSLFKEIIAMFMLKDNILSKLENGGSPDHIIAAKERMSSESFNKVRAALESFSHIKQAHGNLLVEGALDIHPMGMQLKDMEYRELAMFILSEFCLSMGVPVSRVPFLMTGKGGTVNRGEISGDSEDAYTLKRDNRRLTWEKQLNEEVFQYAGFTFRFKRNDSQERIRLYTAANQRNASISSMVDILTKQNLRVKQDSLIHLLAGTKETIDADDIEEIPLEERNMGMPDGNVPLGAPGTEGQSSDTDTGSNQDRARSESRSDSANNNGVSS